MPKATKRYISDLAGHDLPDWKLGDLPDNLMDADCVRPVAKLVTPIEIDVLPSYRGNVLEQGCSLNVPRCFLIIQRLDKSIGEYCLSNLFWHTSRSCWAPDNREGSMAICPKRTHEHVVKAGKVKDKQRWRCRACGGSVANFER